MYRTCKLYPFVSKVRLNLFDEKKSKQKILWQILKKRIDSEIEPSLYVPLSLYALLIQYLDLIQFSTTSVATRTGEFLS
jgi:hypothetical protein